MPRGALLGRDRESEELARLVSEQRLVTVTGTGGIGKTSLAEHVATAVEPRFADGVRRLELTCIDAEDASADAIAGLTDHASLESLSTGIAERQLLILLDNCEHVLDAAATFATTLLERCPGVSVLATSREPLGLGGESLLSLGPLELPSGLPGERAASVQLFLERARAAGATMLDVAGGEPSIEQLCRRLDGIPLAVELAAARSRALTPEEMLKHLDRRFDLLERRRGGGTPRHRSLRATVAWSYELLEPEARDLFDALGVFAGPFTAAMAHAVCASASDDELTTITRLQDLVDASMIASAPSGGTTWYRLLETLRDFACERLADRAEGDKARDRYADHMVAAALAVLAESAERWKESVLSELLGAYPHLRATLLWSLSRDPEPTRTFTLAMLLWGVMHQAHAADVAKLEERVLEKWPVRDHPLWANVASTAAGAHLLLSEFERAEALARDSLRHAADDALAQVTSRRTLAFLARSSGDLEAARAWFAEGAEYARRLGAPPFALELEVGAAQMTGLLGDVEAGLEGCRRARGESGDRDSAVTEIWARTVEASLLTVRDLDVARAAAEEALALAEESAYPWALGANVRTVGIVALLQDDRRGAARHLERAIRHFLEHWDLGELANALRWSAVTIAAAGEPDAAGLVSAVARSLRGISIIEGPEQILLEEREKTLRTPATVGATVRDAIGLAHRELRAIVAGDRSVAAAPSASPVAAVVASAPASASAGASASIFRREDGDWIVTFGERTIRARHSKGMDDLARLLSEAGRDVHCLDLSGAGRIDGDAGEVLDARARRQYEERLRSLREELVESEERNDLGRADLLRAELEAIAGQLESAFGLGGRARRVGDAAERARSSVTQRIRATIGRLEKAHPALGRHLRNSVRTGVFCVYEPEHPIDWET